MNVTKEKKLFKYRIVLLFHAVSRTKQGWQTVSSVKTYQFLYNCITVIMYEISINFH